MGSLYRSEQIGWEIVGSILHAVKKNKPSTASALAERIRTEQSSKIANPRSKRDIQKTIYNMKQRGLLSYDEQRRIVLTKRGAERLDELVNVLSPLKLAKGKKWDGRWRVVSFDIPESNRPARDALRRVIKQLGFVQLQRSVWVHPLPCRRYFDEVQDAYGAKDHILYLVVDKLSAEEKLEKVFQPVIGKAT